MTNKTRCEYHS